MQIRTKKIEPSLTGEQRKCVPGLDIFGLEDLKNFRRTVASIHWQKHLVNSAAIRADTQEELYFFLKEKVLFWLEIISLIGKESYPNVWIPLAEICKIPSVGAQ